MILEKTFSLAADILILKNKKAEFRKEIELLHSNSQPKNTNLNQAQHL